MWDQPLRSLTGSYASLVLQILASPLYRAQVLQKSLLAAPNKDLWCSFSGEALGGGSDSHWAGLLWNGRHSSPTHRHSLKPNCPHLVIPLVGSSDSQGPALAELSPLGRSECCTGLELLEHISLGGSCLGLRWVLDCVVLVWEGIVTPSVSSAGTPNSPTMVASFNLSFRTLEFAPMEGLAGCTQPEPVEHFS